MYKSEKLYYRKAFFMAMIMGVILFLPFVLIDGGYFIYYGDYNACLLYTSDAADE